MLLWKRFTILLRNLSCPSPQFRWKLVGFFSAVLGVEMKNLQRSEQAHFLVLRESEALSTLSENCKTVWNTCTDTKSYKIQLFARMFIFFTSLDQGVQHLQSIVHWSFAINIWLSGISTMHNKEFDLKSLSSIRGNMKWGVTSILWRQGSVSWCKGCWLSYSGLKTWADFNLHTIR